MKKIIVSTILVLLIFMTFSKLTAQNRCRRYHALKCIEHDYKEFQYSGQSRSSEFFKGTKSSFKVSVNAGYDYYFSICYPKELKDVQMKIMEDNASKTLIFDNASEDFVKNKIMSIKVSKTLIVEITIPNDGEEVKPDSQRYCLGVLIEYMKTPKTSF